MLHHRYCSGSILAGIVPRYPHIFYAHTYQEFRS